MKTELNIKLECIACWEPPTANQTATWLGHRIKVASKEMTQIHAVCETCWKESSFQPHLAAGRCILCKQNFVNGKKTSFQINEQGAIISEGPFNNPSIGMFATASLVVMGTLLGGGASTIIAYGVAKLGAVSLTALPIIGTQVSGAVLGAAGGAAVADQLPVMVPLNRPASTHLNSRRPRLGLP